MLDIRAIVSVTTAGAVLAFANAAPAATAHFTFDPPAATTGPITELTQDGMTIHILGGTIAVPALSPPQALRGPYDELGNLPLEIGFDRPCHQVNFRAGVDAIDPRDQQL